VQRWAEAAQAIYSDVRAAGYGEREAVLARHVKAQGLSPQTLRRAVSAYEFCLSKKQSWEVDLTGQPLNAVEHLKRWSQHDDAGAKDAAEDLKAGSLSVRKLETQEKSARLKSKPAASARLGRAAVREKVKASLERHFRGAKVGAGPSLVEFEVSGLQNYNWLPLPDDELRRRDRGTILGLSSELPRPMIAVVLHMALSRDEDEFAKLTAGYVYAIGLLRLYRQVRMYFDDKASLSRVENWAATQGIADRAIQLHIV
jgi:hypothetical protein